MKNNEDIQEYTPNSFLCFIAAFIIVSSLIFISYCSFNKQNLSYSKSIDNVDVNRLVQEKYNSISSRRKMRTNDLIFFTNDDIDINNISKEDVLYIAYGMLSKEDRQVSGSAEFIDKKLLEEQINNFFSSELKMEYVPFGASTNQTCELENELYHCRINQNGSSLNNYTTLTQYDSYELKDDKLIIYSYLLTLRQAYDKDHEKGIYSDSKATNYIDNLDYFTNETNQIFNIENTTKLVDKYKDKITKYKTTFTKENNNYVWYSTEIVK